MLNTVLSDDPVVLQGRRPTEAGRPLIALMETQFDDVLAVVSQAGREATASGVAKLCLACSPPAVDRAWRIIEQLHGAQEVIECIALLLLDAPDYWVHARPFLQHFVQHTPHRDQMAGAVDLLMRYPWSGQREYMLTLLSHPMYEVRKPVIGWFALRGNAGIDDVQPLLSAGSAETRLPAVRVLQRIDSERSRAILRQHLDVERAQVVRDVLQAILGFSWSVEAASAQPESFIADVVAAARSVMERPDVRSASWVRLSRNPGLRWISGEPVPPVVITYLLHCQSQVGWQQPAERVRQITALLDPRTRGALALDLLAAWQADGAKARDAWIFPLLCAIGDTRLLEPLRKQIEKGVWGLPVRQRIASKAVWALAQTRTLEALQTIDEILVSVKPHLIRRAAREAFADAARRQGMTPAQLLGHITPRLSFNDQGEQVLDYGPRQFVVRLGANRKLELRDVGGKLLAAPPKPRKSDDPRKVGMAQHQWQLLREQIKQSTQLQAERLERALGLRLTWDVESWRSEFLRHPVARPYAICSVWGIVDLAKDTTQQPYSVVFRPLDDGSLTDVDDQPVIMPDHALIRLVHPAELDAEQRSQWLQHLADYEIMPPIKQMDRPIATLSPDEERATAWLRHWGYVINGGSLRKRYRLRGWDHGPLLNGIMYSSIWKSFPAAGIEAILEFAVEPSYRENQRMLTNRGLEYDKEWEDEVVLTRLVFVRAETINRSDYVYDELREHDHRALPLGSVPPAVLSEALCDIQVYADRGMFSSRWSRPQIDLAAALP